MRPGSLKKSNAIMLAPNDEPITGICDMAFAAALPGTLQTVHTMPSTQFVFRFGSILDNKINYLKQVIQIKPALFNFL